MLQDSINSTKDEDPNPYAVSHECKRPLRQRLRTAVDGVLSGGTIMAVFSVTFWLAVSMWLRSTNNFSRFNFTYDESRQGQLIAVGVMAVLTMAMAALVSSMRKIRLAYLFAGVLIGMPGCMTILYQETDPIAGKVWVRWDEPANSLRSAWNRKSLAYLAFCVPVVLTLILGRHEPQPKVSITLRRDEFF